DQVERTLRDRLAPLPLFPPQPVVEVLRDRRVGGPGVRGALAPPGTPTPRPPTSSRAYTRLSGWRNVGKLAVTPSIGRVIRYWCSIGTTGISTPPSRPSSWAQIPAAFTTTSASIAPWSVTTPVTRPSRTPTSWTRTPVRILAPPRLAPSAKAIVSPVGSRWPSVGTNCAPSTFETSSSGNRSSASWAETISTGRPKLLAQPACRARASSRYGEEGGV